MGYTDKKDPFWLKAKQEGYRSRAAYKLMQIQRQYRLFRKGGTVVDLGCAPGGWLQVIAEAVGPAGRVVGVDLNDVEPLPFPNVQVIVGDILREETAARIVACLGGYADVVTSDMAPRLSGIRFRDHYLSCRLVSAGLELCRTVLRPGGVYLAKVFEGEGLKDLHAELREAFGEVKRIVPEASKKGSSEVYLLARGFASRPRPGEG
jgi:23S rRNA (uridine2552-2'-O)-methyltransferase